MYSRLRIGTGAYKTQTLVHKVKRPLEAIRPVSVDVLDLEGDIGRRSGRERGGVDVGAYEGMGCIVRRGE